MRICDTPEWQALVAHAKTTLSLRELFDADPSRGERLTVEAGELYLDYSKNLVSDETIRQAIKRLGVGWKRAKTWITSPDPAYLRKKGRATG